MKQKIILILFSIIFGLFCAEIFSRIYFFVLNKKNLVNTLKYKRSDNDRGVFRVAVLGESSAKAWPYEIVGVKYKKPEDFLMPAFSKVMLEEFYKYNEIIIDKFCDGGWTMEQTVKYYFQRVKYKPDLIVILSGFNEIPSYYSPNMKKIPFVLSLLSKLKIGELFLRYFFMKAYADYEIIYSGDFFNKDSIPGFERKWINERYAKYLNYLINHCKKEQIPLIVVVPDGNYTFPPCRNIYKGPEKQKGTAVKLFKKALYYKYFLNDIEKAEKNLLKIKDFSEFADLYFELGDIAYKRNDHSKALEFFRKSIDLDGYSFSPSSEIRNIGKTLSEKYKIPYIDMHNIITKNLNCPVPDYSYYIDNAHLKLQVYFELNKEIINIIKKHNFLNFNNLALKHNIDIKYDDALSKIYVPDDFTRRLNHNTIDWFYMQNNYYFLKYRLAIKMLELEKEINNNIISPELMRKKQEIDNYILKWINPD